MPTCSCNAAQGAIWLADLPLADRLAEAAVRAGAGPEARFLRAHALSWLGRGEEAEAVLADVPITAIDRRGPCADSPICGPATCCGRWPTRRGRKRSSTTRRTPQHAQARSWIDALLTVYWFAMDRPDAATLASKNLALDDLPAIVGTETAWALAAISRGRGPRRRSGGHRRGGIHHRDSLFRRSAHEVQHRRRASSARCCCPAGLAKRWMWPSACASRQPTSPEQLNYSALPLRAGPHWVPATSIPHVRCWNRRQQRCPRRATPSAGGTAITSHIRPRLPCAVALTRPPPRLPRSTSCDVRFGRWTMSGASPGHGWPPARAPSVRRSPSCSRPPKRLQRTGDSRPK